MSDEAQTKPTLETIVQMIGELRDEMRAGFERLDIRLDRLESEVKLARSETLALRADFREFRSQFKEPA